jgi:hypothetical protein
MFRKLLLSLIALLCIGIALTSLPRTPRVAFAKDKGLSLDVAIDGRTFRLDNPTVAPVNPFDPFTSAVMATAQRGNTFIVTGKIYPGGTIPSGGTFASPISFGADHTGSIGTWICTGTFNIPGSDILAGSTEPMVFTNQIFYLGSGNDALFSHGAEASGQTVRAVTGGTGIYDGARGTEIQSTLGVGSAGASSDFNLHFNFDLSSRHDD